MRLDLVPNGVSFEESIFVAVGIESANLVELKASFRVGFGVGFHKLYAIGRNSRQEADVVSFGHGMLYAYEQFVFYTLNTYSMVFVRLFSFQGYELYSMAADGCFA